MAGVSGRPGSQAEAGGPVPVAKPPDDRTSQEVSSRTGMGGGAGGTCS